MGLINSSDYENLPIEPVSRWLKLKDLLDKRLSDAIDFQNGTSTEDLEEYCIVLVNTARTLGLGDFDESADGSIAEDHKYFRPRLIALAANLSIKAPSINLQNSVALPRITKAKIFAQIELLRTMIQTDEISDKQRKGLSTKLDEFHQLVLAPRTDFASSMRTIAYVASTLAATTAFALDVPVLIAKIQAAFGEAIEEEQEAQKMLEKLEKPLQIADQRPRSDLDDDMPF